MAHVVHPRVLVELSLIVRQGDPETDPEALKQVNTTIVPDAVQIQRRSHSHAGTCDVTFRRAALPFDPDHVESGFIAVFIADVGSVGGDIQRPEYIRFLGYLDEFRRDDNDRGPSIQAKARDLSALLRDEPLDPKAIPHYDMTLGEALQGILDSVLAKLRGPNGQALLHDALEIQHDDAALAGVTLDQLVSDPHKSGPVLMPKAKTSSWQAMEHVCGMCARLISVIGQTIRVRLPSEVFGEDGVGDDQDPKVSFIFGSEDDALPDAEAPIVPVMSVGRSRKLRRQRKGLSATVWDTANRRTLTVVYPDKEDLPSMALPSQLTERGAVKAHNKAITAKNKKPAAKATPKPGSSKQKFIAAEDREPVYIRAGIHSEKQIKEYLKLLWKQRSRQEMEGSIETSEIPDGALNLLNGDRVTLHVSPQLEIELREQESRDAKIAYLADRLELSRDGAATLLTASEQPRQTLFYVKGLNINWSKDQKPTVRVDFLNLITIRPTAAQVAA